MQDRDLMENLLLTEKGICDLYLHGAVESSTVNVNQTFSTALKDSLTMQGDIYKKMSEKGWYPSQNAPEQQIQQVKQKFSASAGTSN